MAKLLSVLDAIGRTPLIKLNRIGAELPASIWVKYEAGNPAGSSKDRIALQMINSAEASGALKPGDTIIEATAGNTGVGLAQVAAVKGYKCVFVMPDKMSGEKVDLLKAYGAEVVITRNDVPPDSPENYNILAKSIAQKTPNSFVPSQFENQENPRAHYLTTGPEIWKDTDGQITVFVSGVGTGGTISGCGKYLKEKNKDIKVILADPPGSILSGGDGKPWLVEGIGEDFFPDTFDKSVVDEYIQVSDKEALTLARRLVREEGLFVGGSSGVALGAALKYAAKTRVADMIVVVLPDTGRNYMSKCFSDKWMKDHNLL